MGAGEGAGPFSASAPGCGADAGDGHTGASRCTAAPTHAGLVLFPYPRSGEVWRGFACEVHLERLIAARPLTERDHAELADRRARHHEAVVEHRRWRPPQPLATGAQARALVARARAWQERGGDPGSAGEPRSGGVAAR